MPIDLLYIISSVFNIAIRDLIYLNQKEFYNKYDNHFRELKKIYNKENKFKISSNITNIKKAKNSLNKTISNNVNNLKIANVIDSNSIITELNMDSRKYINKELGRESFTIEEILKLTQIFHVDIERIIQ